MTRTLIAAAAVSVLLAGADAASAFEKRFGLLASSIDAPASGSEWEPPEDAVRSLLLGFPRLEEVVVLRPAWKNELLTHEREAQQREGQSGPLFYDLSPAVSASIGYHHELLFPTAASKDLRTSRFSLFAAQPDRDVLDLHLFWRLPWSELSFGYQLQSDRATLAAAAQNYSLHRFVSDTGFDYALTIGVRHRFGGN